MRRLAKARKAAHIAVLAWEEKETTLAKKESAFMLVLSTAEIFTICCLWYFLFLSDLYGEVLQMVLDMQLAGFLMTVDVALISWGALVHLREIQKIDNF